VLSLAEAIARSDLAVMVVVVVEIENGEGHDRVFTCPRLTSLHWY
jgi:hypothetical protein